MQLVKYILCFFCLSTFPQESISVSLVSKSELDVNTLVQIDEFGTLYYIENNTFYSQNKSKTINYNNFQLGEITSANAFNPLKINLFYNNFNTAVILDNRLAEITKINFNTLQPLRNVTHISTGNDNTLWLFNQDTQELELFDYKTSKTRAKSLPINENILDIKGNYNYCWLLTNIHIYTYNYFGSLVSKIEHNGYKAFQEYRGDMFFLKHNKLFYKQKSSNEIKELKLPELLIKQFLVTNETLYIYNGEFLYHYQLITN